MSKTLASVFQEQRIALVNYRVELLQLRKPLTQIHATPLERSHLAQIELSRVLVDAAENARIEPTYHRALLTGLERLSKTGVLQP
mgnify:CR=1 FL=1